LSSKIENKPQISSPNEGELMQRVVERDETAFEMLVRRHEDAVFRLASHILGNNPEEARDVAQDIFLYLWENPRSWKPKAQFSTWLYRVTTNRALNRRRALKVKSFFSLADFEDEQMPATDEDPSQSFEVTEEGVRFEKEFNALPPRQRAALHLRYRENLSVGEVAGSLGVSVKSAESLLFRGRQRLRERLVQNNS